MNAIVISGDDESQTKEFGRQLAQMFTRGRWPYSPPLEIDEIVDLQLFYTDPDRLPPVVTIYTIKSRDKILEFIEKTNGRFPRLPIIIITKAYLLSSPELPVYTLTNGKK